MWIDWVEVCWSSVTLRATEKRLKFRWNHQKSLIHYSSTPTQQIKEKTYFRLFQLKMHLKTKSSVFYYKIVSAKVILCFCLSELWPYTHHTKLKRTSFFCKVKFTLLQSKFFPAKFFFCILKKGNFGGEKLLFKRVNLLCKEGFSSWNSPKKNKADTIL